MFIVTANNINITNLTILYNNTATNTLNSAIFLQDNILNIRGNSVYGSNANLNNVNINTLKNNSIGIYGQNWYGNLIDSDINTIGNNSVAIIAYNSIRGAIINSDISSSGFASPGIYTNFFDRVIQNIDINTYGNSAYGFYLYYLLVNSNYFTNIHGVNINTFGDNSIGIYKKMLFLVLLITLVSLQVVLEELVSGLKTLMVIQIILLFQILASFLMVLFIGELHLTLKTQVFLSEVMNF